MSGLPPESTLGGYRILARLRAGAMGVLYLGRRVGPAGFARPVAIKVIHDHLANNERFVRMFVEEAKLAARIDDPNVVRVEELGQEDGRYYLVMEYVHGCSLAHVLGVLGSRGGVPRAHAVAIAMQIASGLHGAHEARDEQGQPLGIVHRDVSPHNVLVSYAGHVRVIDFGIAKAGQQSKGTKTGSLRGKLAYMPPEQARSAKHVDRRADLYALGLVLWEMLTGRRFFDAPSDIALLAQLREPKPVPPSAYAPDIPRELDAVVLRTLSLDPAGRPATGAELQRLLGDAYPQALRVLPSDLAALMSQVRAAATQAVPEGGGGYAEEIRAEATLFGEKMHESIAAAGAVLDPSATTAPTAPNARPPSAPPLAPAADDPGMTAALLEERTLRKMPRVPRPSGASLAATTRVADLAPPPKPPFRVDPKAVIAIGAPVIVAALLTIGFVAGERGDARTPVPRPAAAPSESVAATPPPPAAVLIGVGGAVPVPSATAAAPAQPPGPVDAAPPPSAVVAGDDPFALAVEGEAGAARARQLLEARGLDYLSPDELRLLAAICRAQKDAACAARIAKALGQ